MTVGEAWAAERPLLRALPAEPFDASETAAPRVDAKALVTVRQNRYSVPGRAGRAEGQRADRRARDHDQPRRPRGRPPRAAARQVRHQRPARSLPRAARSASPAALEHSLALAPGARPRRLARAASTSCGPALTDRYGRSEAARQMVDVAAALPRARARPASSSRSAARSPPARIDGRAVAVLARRAETAHDRAGAADRPGPAPGRARPARARPRRLRPAARRHPMTTRRTRRPRRWRR